MDFNTTLEPSFSPTFDPTLTSNTSLISFDPTHLQIEIKIGMIAFTIAGICSLVSSLWVLRAIILHLMYFKSPFVQKIMVRILFMVPIYAFTSFIALIFKHYSFYLVVARDCYEAFVLYSFFRLLIEFARGEDELVEKLEEVPQISYAFPFCQYHIKPGRIFLHRCKQLILQYVPIKIILTIVTFICEIGEVYHEGDFSPRYAYLWISLTYNFSLTVCLYFLVLFYDASAEILVEFKPIWKFLCIKAIIFFAFWQSVVLAGLVLVGVLKEVGSYSANEFSVALQNLLICVELLPLSFCFTYAFGHKSFKAESVMMEKIEEGEEGYYEIEDDLLRDPTDQPSIKKFFWALWACINIADVLYDSAVAMKSDPERNVIVGNFLDLTRREQNERIVYHGWFCKRGEDLVKIWKKRYGMLINDPPGIAYFMKNVMDESDGPCTDARGFIEISEDLNTVVTQVGKISFVVANPARSWKIRCMSETDRDMWIASIKKTCPRVDFQIGEVKDRRLCQKLLCIRSTI